jgi:phosphohistidine phosphatase
MREHELYLIRHGVAEDHGPAWPDDSKRPLTENGVKRLRKSGEALRQLGVTFDVVLTSPLVRTRQTAEILADAFDPAPPIIDIDALAPGSSPASALAELEKHGRKGGLAIVGHEPGIGELASRLLGLRHAIEFKKGAVCRIDVDTLPPTSPGALRFFLTPKVLRAIRKG